MRLTAELSALRREEPPSEERYGTALERTARYAVQMWGRKKPKPGHVAVVLLADPRDGSFPPYYVGQCDCGWLGDTLPDEASAFEQAHQHAEQVDPEVRDTLHPDYKPH